MKKLEDYKEGYEGFWFLDAIRRAKKERKKKVSLNKIDFQLFRWELGMNGFGYNPKENPKFIKVAGLAVYRREHEKNLS